MAPLGLKKSEILKSSKSIKRIFQDGKVIKGKYLTVLYLYTEEGKVAFFVSKKVGKAVYRNKCRRWLRAIYRENRPLINNTIHIILLIPRSSSSLTYKKLKADWEEILMILNQNKKRSTTI